MAETKTLSEQADELEFQQMQELGELMIEAGGVDECVARIIQLLDGRGFLAAGTPR